MTPEPSILVVVHPGSACGSATFNLGGDLARSMRDRLVAALDTWSGPVLVLDGELSDELAHYPNLDEALAGALKRAAHAGHLALRVEADDPSHVDIGDHHLASWCAEIGHRPQDVGIVLTGAWYHDDSTAGCVNALALRLSTRHYKSITIDDSVLRIEADDLDADLTGQDAMAP
jgi:hypothetical protein